MDSRQRVAASIEEAKADLNRALEELEHVPVHDPSTVGYVAHVLNNYLTVTSVTVELLQGALRESTNPEVRIWLDGIEHVTDMMHHTITKLTEVSTPGDFPLRLGPMNLYVMMKRACNHYARVAHLKQIGVEYRAIGEVPLVLGDRVAVAVVADNLLSNAIKVSRPGSTVRVLITSEPGHAVCTIRDEGPGISRADQARLFQRGFTLEPPTEGTGPSRGFGLAVAKEFIDRMNGSIWCESEPGRGSRFSFRLPAHE
jgi:signal transduction histidine kinase